MPNIVLITVDSLRRDAVGAYGADVETPHMDALAEQGAALDTAIANAPYTAASFPAILFGQLTPNSTKDTYRIEGESIAAALQAQGYETAAFHSNPYLGADYGYAQGFDTFEAFGGETVEMDSRINRLKGFLKQHDILGKLVRVPYYYYTHWQGIKPFLDGEAINDAFVSWHRDVEEPFFAWVHYMDVHHPYMPEETAIPFWRHARIMRKMQQGQDLTAAEEEIAEQLYRKKVQEVDAYIGELVDMVDDDTLIVLTSDHGEAFGDHGFYMHRPRLYDEVLTVPLIVNQGDAVAADQYPLRTLPAFLRHVAETSMVDLGHLAQDTAYCICKDLDGDVSVAERTPDEKYIIHEGGENECYALDTDPEERENIIDDRRDTDREGRIRDQIDSGGETVQKSDAVKDRLRDLGYQS